MAINTPGDIVLQALKRCNAIGIGQTPAAEDAADAFDTMNGMISQWNRKRWLCWALDDISCASTGAISYTIGPGQSFATSRPDRLEAAYVRLLPVINNQPFDRWLDLIDSHEDYSTLGLKNLQSYPMSIFYDSQFPIGNIYPYPVGPAGQYEYHILVKNQIEPFTSLAEEIRADVPPEYFEALSWNLAARLRPAYGLPPDPSVINLAKISLNVIRQANVQVPTLSMPAGYPRNGGLVGDPWWSGLLR